MSREELLNRLYAVQAKAKEIVDTMRQQTKVAASFRTYEAEMEHVDKGVFNKAKYIFYVLLGAYIMMRLVVAAVFMLYYKNSENAQEIVSDSIYILIATVLLFVVFRNSTSKIISVLRFLFMVNLARSSLLYFSISIGDLAHGVFWSSLVHIAIFGVAIYAITRLLRYQNKKIDTKNELINIRNMEREEKNQELESEYNRLSTRIFILREQFAELADPSWYPVDQCYFSLEAINTLISLIANHQANTMTEAVREFQAQQHEERMLQYQQSILDANRQTHINQGLIMGQLAFANVMQAQSVALQCQTNRLLAEGNSAQGQIASTLKDAYLKSRR